MKTLKYIIATATFILTFTLINAQTPPPPNGGNNPTAPGSENTPVGGGAPIAGGAGILLAMGAAYGAKKVFVARKSSFQ